MKIDNRANVDMPTLSMAPAYFYRAALSDGMTRNDAYPPAASLYYDRYATCQLFLFLRVLIYILASSIATRLTFCNNASHVSYTSAAGKNEPLLRHVQCSFQNSLLYAADFFHGVLRNSASTAGICLWRTGIAGRSGHSPARGTTT